MRPSRRVALWAGTAFLVLAPPTHAQTLRYTGSASYSGGSYIFDRRSDTYAVGTGATLTLGPFTFGANIPFLVYNGGLVTTVTEGVGLPTGGTQSGAVRDREPGSTIGTKGKGKGSGSGPGATAPIEPPSDTTVDFDESFATSFADPLVSGSAEVHSGTGRIRSVTITGSAKIPVADVSSGVSSGEWDVGVGASVVVSVGSALVLADLAYWWIGDMPDLPLDDGVSYAVGVSAPIRSGEFLVTGLVSGLSQTIETMDPPVSVTAAVSRLFGSRTFGSLSVGFGLTEAAPDLYVSLGWSVRVGG
jgi:hypothetical protein